MKHFFILLSFLFTIRVSAQSTQSLSSDKKIRLYVDPATNSDDPEKRMAYGLNVEPPWEDGGYFFINLPEHLWYMPDTKGIARHHDQRKNVWKVSKDGTEAGYDVESILAPGVRLSVKAIAGKDRVNFEMTIKNNSSVLLKSIGPLFCFQYHHLKGFPAALTDNFSHTYVMMNSKPVLLKDIAVKNNDAVARMAQVKQCTDEHNWWAEKMGGMIEEPIDLSLTALTSLSGDKKVVVSWSPGKSILSNSFIPCIHADPCIGDLAKGESRTVKGVLLFTTDSLNTVVSELSDNVNTVVQPHSVIQSSPETGKGIAYKYPGDAGIEKDPDVLFVEEFDDGLKNMLGRYQNTYNTEGMQPDDDVPSGSHGKHSLKMTNIGGKNTGGHLYKVFPDGFDSTLYLRYYVKYPSISKGYIHHQGVWFGGYNPAINYPYPRAGICGLGDKRISIAYEPVNDMMGTYLYWGDMQGDPRNRCWGNDLINNGASAKDIAWDEWICVEMMIKLNNQASGYGGELRVWQNGEETGHWGPGFPKGKMLYGRFTQVPDGAPFSGFRWREDKDLKINYLWIEFYDDTSPENISHYIKFDQIVLAKKYIGPIKN